MHMFYQIRMSDWCKINTHFISKSSCVCNLFAGFIPNKTGRIDVQSGKYLAADNWIVDNYIIFDREWAIYIPAEFKPPQKITANLNTRAHNCNRNYTLHIIYTVQMSFGVVEAKFYMFTWTNITNTLFYLSNQQNKSRIFLCAWLLIKYCK